MEGNTTIGDGCWVRSASNNIERGILLPGAYVGESAHLEDCFVGPYRVPRENASAVPPSFARRKRGFEDSFRGVVRAHRRKGGARSHQSGTPGPLQAPRGRRRFRPREREAIRRLHDRARLS
jgi:hypothetical protein